MALCHWFVNKNCCYDLPQSHSSTALCTGMEGAAPLAETAIAEAADASLNAVSTDFSAQSAARKYPQKVSPAAVVSTAYTLNIGWE